MDAKDLLKSAVRRFAGMVGELQRFMADSEKVFLGAGAKLQHLEESASDLLLGSSNSTRMGTLDDNPAERLKQGLSQLDQHLERSQAETETGLNALTAVLAGIQELLRLDGEFRTVVASLHALASTTHLENSRWSAQQGGFDSVVRDLRGMAVQIKPKFGEVLAQSHEVKTTAESALAQARTFLDRNRRDVRDLRRETQGQLAVMTTVFGTSHALANKAMASVEEVRAAIARVLQSLQVQDIVRQMLEHVVQDLHEFAQSAEQAMARGESDDQLRSWLAELAIVSQVQAAQMDNACNRLATGLVQVEGSLRSIVSTLGALAKESSTFAGRDSSTSTLHQLERGIQATTETLRGHGRQATSTMNALGKVSDTANGIEALVGEVARLGRDARFIGLNAMVKAVRVGQAGATLTVLSREIQDVSDQIQALTASAAGIMKTVGTQAHLLIGAASEAGTSSSEQIATDLEALMQALGTYQSSLTNVVGQLLAGGSRLHAEVATIGHSLQGLAQQVDRLRQGTLQLSDVQRQAAREARGARPPAGRPSWEERRYTMEEERKVQRAALGKEVVVAVTEKPKSADESSEEGSVEFF